MFDLADFIKRANETKKYIDESDEYEAKILRTAQQTITELIADPDNHRTALARHFGRLLILFGEEITRDD